MATPQEVRNLLGAARLSESETLDVLKAELIGRGFNVNQQGRILQVAIRNLSDSGE